MTIPVRPARYDSDEQELIDLLQINLPYRPHARFFPWLYRKNPAGQAMAWVAADPATNRIIGAAAAFPRHLACGGKDATGYVLGDFCIDPKYRSLGLALSLQRACLDGISSRNRVFAFDFPSQSMLAIYKRLRIEVNSTMVRYAKLLRADRKIAGYTSNRSLASRLSKVVNAGLRLSGVKKISAPWTIAEEPGPWGEEFTQAARQWNPSTGICVLRTADHLNWRYRQHPLQSYEMWTARQGRRLCGYLIFHMNGEDGIIDDVWAEQDAVRLTLVSEATVRARERGVQTLSAAWLSTHPGQQILKQAGFRPREPRPVVLLALGDVPEDQGAPEKDNWYLTNGDWEG